MADIAQSDLADNFRVIITDRKGLEVLSFRIRAEERYIISNRVGAVTSRKLSRDDLYWSKETIMEVVREMTSGN
ncbi:hypothetical protein AV553_22660 [Salmonella enterica]|nr:hypothetical protein [Salmonella enterica]ECH9261027.1 hypothetical protein [Salmonella enterica subsp. enterica]EDW9589357.1 hypothetical protein [Salmonella enterica subsp. enterica]EED9675502.1 hypothetical protein [Salmonella enterica subsp. enterica]